MTAHIYAHEFSYFSVPKCACTSLKMMFFELENGFPFQDFSANGSWFHIHRFYISVPFNEARRAAENNAFRFSVIRDPKARVESCYKHWVASENGKKVMVQNSDAFNAQGVPVNPSLEEFVDGLDIYRAQLSNIAHHTQPLSYFLGTDPDYFDEIYSLKRLPELLSLLEERTRVPLNLQHHNVSEAASDFTGSDARIEGKINARYAEDFELYEKFFR